MLMNLPEILKNQKAKVRKFKPVKMSKRTELWYRQQLKHFVKTMTDDVERALQQPQGSFFMHYDKAALSPPSHLIHSFTSGCLRIFSKTLG